MAGTSSRYSYVSVRQRRAPEAVLGTEEHAHVVSDVSERAPSGDESGGHGGGVAEEADPLSTEERRILEKDVQAGREAERRHPKESTRHVGPESEAAGREPAARIPQPSLPAPTARTWPSSGLPGCRRALATRGPLQPRSGRPRRTMPSSSCWNSSLRRTSPCI